MKVKVIGRNRPFWDDQLRNIGDIVDVPADIFNDESKRGRWMEEHKSRGRPPKADSPKTESEE